MIATFIPMATTWSAYIVENFHRRILCDFIKSFFARPRGLVRQHRKCLWWWGWSITCCLWRGLPIWVHTYVPGYINLMLPEMSLSFHSFCTYYVGTYLRDYRSIYCCYCIYYATTYEKYRNIYWVFVPILQVIFVGIVHGLSLEHI